MTGAGSGPSRTRSKLSKRHCAHKSHLPLNSNAPSAYKNMQAQTLLGETLAQPLSDPGTHPHLQLCKPARRVHAGVDQWDGVQQPALATHKVQLAVRISADGPKGVVINEVLLGKLNKVETCALRRRTRHGSNHQARSKLTDARSVFSAGVGLHCTACQL